MTTLTHWRCDGCGHVNFEQNGEPATCPCGAASPNTPTPVPAPTPGTGGPEEWRRIVEDVRERYSDGGLHPDDARDLLRVIDEQGAALRAAAERVASGDGWRAIAESNATALDEMARVLYATRDAYALAMLGSVCAFCGTAGEERESGCAECPPRMDDVTRERAAALLGAARPSAGPAGAGDVVLVVRVTGLDAATAQANAQGLADALRGPFRHFVSSVEVTPAARASDTEGRDDA